MNNKFVLFATGCILVGLMLSCSGREEYYEYDISRDCQIASFSLTSRSNSEFAKVEFTIDQLSGKIYNTDSMSFGTEVGKVSCTIKYIEEGAVGSIKAIQEAVGDTIDWNGTDSLDFSKPIRFIVIASDEVINKVYDAKINVHQIDPDTLIWNKISSETTGQAMLDQKTIPFTYQGNECYLLYAQPSGTNLPYRLYYSLSSDMKNWQEIELKGIPTGKVHLTQMIRFNEILYLPSTDGQLLQSTDGQSWNFVEQTPYVSYLLGNIKAGEKQPSPFIAAIVKEENELLRFASMDESGTWTLGDVVPENFPLTGFGYANYTSMYFEYLMIAGGRDNSNMLTNTVWGTKNGTSWALLTDEEANYFDRREGATVIAYDKKLYLIGGINALDQAYRDLYVSVDNGVSWTLVENDLVLPETYRARGYASIYVDKDNYINIIGGRAKATGIQIRDVWRGRITRLGF